MFISNKYYDWYQQLIAKAQAEMPTAGLRSENPPEKYARTLTASALTPAASRFNGSVTESGVTQSFSLSSPATTAYVYNTPALVSSVTGTWSGNLTDGESGSVTILSDGTFTGASSGGCGFSGKFTPRPSGVNVFNVTLNFGVSLCSYPGQVATGIAVVTSLSNGTSELIVTGTLPSLAAGTAFFAVR